MAGKPSGNFLEGEFNVSKLEEEVLKFWEERRIFEKSLEQTKEGKPFTFYDGPPFATGLPHYGHILASTIKDVVPRYQTMNGHFVRRRWGWDCHGLPIEEIVERKLGISGKKQIEEIGIKKFNETCRSMVLEYAGEWKKMVRRIARWTEFDDSYKTMDTDYMESVWWAFKEIYDKKLAYEGRKVLLYCPRCETPVSNFEVAMDNSYRDVSEESVTVKFKVKNPEKINLAGQEIYLLAWTTTPWTLPGNVALAVGEEISYSIIKPIGPDAQNVRYILAEPRRTDVMSNLGVWELVSQLKGAELVGLEYEPLFNVPAVAAADSAAHKAFHVYPADFVTTEDGTGIVHTAVVYGEDDYALGIKEGLPVVPLLDEKGRFNDKAPEFVRGKSFKDSENFIKEDLQNRGLLFKREMHTHSYPFCWRCGKTLFYNAIPAWFVNVQKIKEKLLKSNDREINWFPEHLKHGRYEKSVEAAPDWNISRNRYWGNPIPVWKCADCGKEEAVGSLQELSEHAAPPKNNYWVMRHGEAESNMFDILDSGQRKFLHLTPRGKKQVEDSIAQFATALKKEHKKIDLIIASDITRTKETVAIDLAELASAHFAGVPVEIDKHLEEIHLGPTLTGYRDEKYHELYPTYRARFEERPEGGESLRDLRARMWDFIRDCEATHEGKNILLVTHEYPTWMLTHVAAGWSERRATEEKEKLAGDFIGFAEIQKLDLRTIPRNDTGLADLHRPYIDEITFPCKACKGAMKRTPEIFDSWMEAGSMPFSEYHYPFENKALFLNRFPAQFVAEYIAQTRAWFYVMHVVSLILFGKAPFDNVVTTGTILAGDGSKMSKSKGNYPDPWLVLEKYGADSLRFYLMNSPVMQADNLNFSEKSVEGVYRKVELLLVNVYKYFATYTKEEGAGTDSAAGNPNVLDQWIELRTQELVKTVTDSLDAYDTVHATRAIQEYVDDLSTWYLRRSRKRHDAAFFNTLRDSMLMAGKVIAPFMPYLAEALYSALAHFGGSGIAESVHLTEWPKAEFTLGEKDRADLLAAMAAVRRLASVALAKRAEVKIKVRQPLAVLIIKSSPELKGKDGFLKILADEVNVKEVRFDATIAGEVALDIAITPELREEGLVREVARTVQGLRQEAGLHPNDAIALMLELPADMKDAITKNEAAFRKDIGAKTVEYAKSEKFSAEAATKIDGHEVWIGMRKI